MSRRNTGSRAHGAKVDPKKDNAPVGLEESHILSLGAIQIYKLNVKNNRDIADIIYEPNDTNQKSSKFDWCCCCRFAARQKEKAKTSRNDRVLEMKDPLLHKKGDDELAHNAHLYHYQQKKKQLLEEERRSNISSGGSGCDETVPLNGRSAVVNSGGDMEEDDYDEDDDQEVTINGQPVKTTVYECSGLASTEDMEIRNPLFEH